MNDQQNTADTEAALREQFEALQPVFERERTVVDEWLENLVDPELGSAGKALRKTFLSTGAAEFVNPRLTFELGMYYAMHFPNQPETSAAYGGLGFNRKLLGDRGQLFSTRNHEIIHALQWFVIAAIHTRHPESPIILCPRDYVTLYECMELDACIKQAWFDALAVNQHPEIEKTLNGFPLPPREFKNLRTRTGNLQETMKIAAKDLARSSNDPYSKSRANPTPERALLNYAEILKNLNGRRPIVVRLGPEDIASLGQSFGPNIFADGLPVQPHISDALCGLLLNGYNAALGIKNEDKLPTFSDTLRKKFNITAADFLDLAKKEKLQTLRPIPSRWEKMAKLFIPSTTRLSS